METKVETFQENQIGGCITAITYTSGNQTNRIMIDYGCSLSGSENKEEFKYPWNEKPVDAIFFTHYHGDHVGRIMEIPDNIPIYMGETSRKVMINIYTALSRQTDKEGKEYKKQLELLQNDERIHTFRWNGTQYDAIEDISNFRIEPYSVDHSAYDAYMFLIETPDDTKPVGKKVILHTGDFRGHGRLGKAVIPMINTYIRKHGKRSVDAMIIEGTMMSRKQEKVLTEYQLQMVATQYLKKHKYAFLICSSTNLDSLASFYQAAQKASDNHKRYMYTYSGYVKQQLKTFSETAGRFSKVYKFKYIDQLNFNKTYIHKKWDRPMPQKELMNQYGFIALIKPEDFCEKYIDEFLDRKPVIIYSMWDGYLDSDNKACNESWIQFLERQKSKGIEVKHLHTSGHATVKLLTEVIKKVNPQEEIIPIHTEYKEGFEELEIGEKFKMRIRR